MNISVGKVAPSFSLPDQSGKIHTLDDYSGKWLVLFFYPKDNTPGCTLEACSFRDAHTELSDMASILGISTDSAKSHDAFAKKHSLPYPLLVDSDKSMSTAYDVWRPKKMFGKEYFGINRTTFLISPEGKVAYIWEKVQPINHAEQILKQLQSVAVHQREQPVS